MSIERLTGSVVVVVLFHWLPWMNGWIEQPASQQWIWYSISRVGVLGPVDDRLLRSNYLIPFNYRDLICQLTTFFWILPSFSFPSSVVAQAYKVEIEVLSASRGCTAILQCVVPSFVKELVRVVSWVQEPAFHIYPSLQGGKFHHRHPYRNQQGRVGEREIPLRDNSHHQNS